MAKLLLLMSLMLLFVSCNQSDCSTQEKQNEDGQTITACPVPTPDPEPNPDPGPGPSPEPEPEPDPGEGDVPPEASIFEVNAKLFEFDSRDEEKVRKAFEIIKKVVGSEEFKNRVLNFTYQGKKQFFENKSLSNEQVYKTVLDGSEELAPGIDHEMDIELELYYSWRNTVGYTYANKPRIYINTKFFDVYTPAEVAGNVFHEWTHKLGFEHASSNTTGRSSTVPYALGYLVEELGKQYE
jgi:hypothetical protein